MRPVLAVAIVAALALPGCLSATPLDAASLAPQPEPLAFGVPLAMEQPTGGAEPNIAILPDGTLFVTAVAGSQERPNHEQGAAWLWRSTDGGDTWSTLREPQRETPLGSLPQTRRPFGSSDADVITSPDGWVYYSDWWNWGAPVIAPATGAPLPASPNARYGSYLVERSFNGGITWESTPITTLDSLGGIDRQWLVAGPDGFVGLFYAYFHGVNPARGADGLAVPPQGRSSIQAVYSHDHGVTWGAPQTVVEAPADEFSQISHPRMRADGLLWMPHAWTKVTDTYWTDASEVRVALSRDEGASWDVVKVADVPGGFDNLWAVQGAHDAQGTLHVAWAARHGEEMAVYHSESRDDGATWSDPLAVSAPGLAFLPWVDATGDGRVAIGFYATDATGEPDEANEDTEWFAVVAQRIRPGAPFEIARAQEAPVKVGSLCPRGAACGSDRELLDYFSLAYDAEGRLHVAYAQSRDVAGVPAGLVTYVASP